ncbi:MAG: dephospho-CoA kinase [Gammaproteobacteria bacterium]|nr:dephospho-CoA kinase [Gammaproteobacteria bacterium]
MLKIGLTGGIGSGKTSVSDVFERLGIPVIDTDVIARGLVNENEGILQQIADTFGPDVVKQSGEIDRKKLAQLVFHSKENKQSLERILHPEIKAEVLHQIKILSSSQIPPAYIIIVVPLLLESNYHDIIDRILVVIADEALRIARVQKRDRRSMSEIRAIIKHQVDDSTRLDAADDIIENNSNFNMIENQVESLHEKYLRLCGVIR